jgi:NAD(P)-dependent dehydrogenase (short-subunit alcohol dehydrogenase family)
MLKNKLVVVTGGAGLLGKEFIKGILANGGTGIIADKDTVKGKAFEKELKNKNVFFYELDINSEKSIAILISKLVKKFGKIDALVNNAYPRNKKYGRKFEDVTYKDFCENVNLHLGGYFLCCQKFAGYFKKQGFGNIVNMSSVYGVIPPRFEIYAGTKMTMPVEYAVIKSGIIMLSKYLAKYYGGSGVRFNSISPGGIKDNQPKSFLKSYKKYCNSKGMLDKSDLTSLLVFLLSDESRFIYGHNIVIDDGFSL